MYFFHIGSLYLELDHTSSKYMQIFRSGFILNPKLRNLLFYLGGGSPNGFSIRHLYNYNRICDSASD